MARKLVVSIEGHLAKKYGDDITIIHELLHTLANANPEIEGNVVYIDNPDSMAQFGLPPIEKATTKICKEAIDRLYEKTNPDYLVIFGSQDVFPFQLLSNLIYTRTEERQIPSDLPYASSSPYSTSIRDFLNPTRSIGRIPDVPGTADIDSVRAMIKSVETHLPASAEHYRNYFALCSERWMQSAKTTLTDVFGHADQLVTVPGVEELSDAQLTSPSHYINCHGAYRFYGFQGESTNSQRRPDALFGSSLVGKISKGTVVASGCCYGATVFPPLKGMKSIPTQYLENGAVAYVGSSTITYGGVQDSQCADVICKLFLQNILDGMNSGTALLKARQTFIEERLRRFDVQNAKVMAQFYLLGDPSLQLVHTSI